MNVAGPAVAVIVLLLPPWGLGAAEARSQCVVGDPRIDEASGLVDLGQELVTTDDSGDAGVLYVLDQRCRTVGTRTYAGSGGADGARDVEALAPAGQGHVWVGDIGDNLSSRDDVVVRRVPVGRGDRRVDVSSYRLVYPDGAHDAETLLRAPGTGRLYVVTKQLLSSQVYAAPRRLDPDGPNRLEPVARVSLTPTDGAFLADGRRVVLRGYDRASVYAVPGWRLIGSVRLPEQPQGESLAAGPGDRIRIGSEGTDQPVLDVGLPARFTLDSARRGEDTAASGREDRGMDSQRADESPWSGAGLVAGLVAVLALALAGGLVALARRRR